MTIASAKVATRCLILHGVYLVPHLNIIGHYALPGGLIATEKELMRRGAKMTMQLLWPKLL
jgi:hypothetical protein